MGSLNKYQTYELSKLRILSYLSEPERAEHGARAYDIERDVGPRPVAEAGKRGEIILSEMQAAGLIERRQDAADRRGNPFFITERGRDYLADATDKALFSEELAQWKTWMVEEDRERWRRVAARVASKDAGRRSGYVDEVADILRVLPEFRDSGMDRIQEVSQQIAIAIARSVDHQR
jgi:hypothetical protein